MRCKQDRHFWCKKILQLLTNGARSLTSKAGPQRRRGSKVAFDLNLRDSTAECVPDGQFKLDFTPEESGDPEVATRIAQYELAYRMQSSVPELTDLSSEPKATFDAYGPESRKRGTFASNCILARRLAERDVRFVQLFHMGWDQHKILPNQIPGQCYDTDQPSAALIEDLDARGLLDDTLVIWGGEFGRTVYCQGTLTEDNYGRDHHPRCFTIFMAGAGIKPGITHGVTDEFGYNITQNPVHVHDLHATILHLLGIDHEQLTFKFQGRHYRLTDVHGHPVREIMA